MFPNKMTSCWTLKSKLLTKKPTVPVVAKSTKNLRLLRLRRVVSNYSQYNATFTQLNYIFCKIKSTEVGVFNLDKVNTSFSNCLNKKFTTRINSLNYLEIKLSLNKQLFCRSTKTIEVLCLVVNYA